MRLSALALCGALALGACDSGGAADERVEAARAAAPASTPSPGVATALLQGDRGPVLVTVEVAQTPGQRRRGLMFRESLAPHAGMIFLFFEPTRSGFWMKNTRIPLSIAFFDADGEIVDILDMEPCRADPCGTYYAKESYFGALEVNRGAFDRWGISEGDSIEMNQ